jgi:hypothetical protein
MMSLAKGLLKISAGIFVVLSVITLVGVVMIVINGGVV